MVNPDFYAEVLLASGDPGSMTQLADKLGVTVQTVNNWRYRGFPPDKCKAIESITGISVKRLLPGEWQKYWPELTEAA